MQKLTTVRTQHEAENITELLKSRGITCFIGNNDSASPVVVEMFEREPKIEVWIIMDEQLADAKELLSNPYHQVERPLTEREMELIDEIDNKQYSPDVISLIKFAVMIFIGTILLCVVAYWLRS